MSYLTDTLIWKFCCSYDFNQIINQALALVHSIFSHSTNSNSSMLAIRGSHLPGKRNGSDARSGDRQQLTLTHSLSHPPPTRSTLHPYTVEPVSIVLPNPRENREVKQDYGAPHAGKLTAEEKLPSHSTFSGFAVLLPAVADVALYVQHPRWFSPRLGLTP